MREEQLGGTYPDWYDSLMGVQYLTWAGYGTGPVYVDSDVVGTDLAMSSGGSAYPAKYTMSWYDEWYTYVSSPATLPDTKMMWTTRTSAFNFSGTNEFNISGDVQPIAWARAVQGGRFVLNSMFHSDSARVSTNPQLRQFIDGAVLGILRYVAGYTGCMDSTYREYNPKATDSGAGACVNKIATSIQVGGFGNGGPVKADHLGIAFTQPGPHSLQVFDSRGRRVFLARGQGAHTYHFDGLKPGVYFLNARSGRDTFNHSFLLL